LGDEAAALRLLGATSLDGVPPPLLADTEADVFWCYSTILASVLDCYTVGQPGVAPRLDAFRAILAAADAPLAAHLDRLGVTPVMYAYRWLGVLLLRELPLPLVVRVWDAAVATDDGFGRFFVAVCAALAVAFSERLRGGGFDDALGLLQHLPTGGWGTEEVDAVLARAHLWHATGVGGAPARDA